MNQSSPPRRLLPSAYMWQLAHGRRKPSATLALAIERETSGAVTVADLAPDFATALAAAGYTKPQERKAA